MTEILVTPRKCNMKQKSMSSTVSTLGPEGASIGLNTQVRKK